MATLLPSDSSDSEDNSNALKINESYAKTYDRFREKEIYQKLKAKYGEEAASAKLKNLDNAEESDESTSESEDEDGEAITEELEKDFFKTLACLKKKDPRIYDKSTKFFSTEAVKKTSDGTKKKEKPMYLGDLERKVMLEKGGKYDDLEDQELKRKDRGKTYVEEMQDMDEEMRKLGEDEGEDSDDNILIKKEATQEEKEKEEAEYREWLVGKKAQLKDKGIESDLKGLKDFWSKDDLDEGEKFLRDYILNKKYLGNDEDEEVDDDDYDRKVHDSDEGLSEDEKTLKEMEEFEHKYNFRFEEPDPEFIKRYPRTIQESMRRQDNKRKKKREEVQERKRLEKEKRQQELKELKALKKKEILEKLEKLKKVSGAKDLEFNDEDVEGDFDPEEYDKRMAQVFSKYDHVPIENEDEKPGISDLESDLEDDLAPENWDEWAGPEENGQEEADDDYYDEDFIMDCDYEENLKKQTESELIEASKGKRKRRKKSKFAEVVEKKKPVFNPEDKTFEQYLDEYYKLDYEDLIAGGKPCRFKYRSVVSNDFGLTTEEILSAPDRELNSWCSLKKTCQYRNEDDEKNDVRAFKARRNNVVLKKKFLPSLFEDDAIKELEAEKEKKAKKGKKKRKRNQLVSDEGDHDEGQTSKTQKVDEDAMEQTNERKQKKKKQKNKAHDAVENKESSNLRDGGHDVGGEAVKKRKKKKKMMNNEKKKKDVVNADLKMSDDRLKAYGLNPNQLKRKVKKKKYKDQGS